MIESLHSARSSFKVSIIFVSYMYLAKFKSKQTFRDLRDCYHPEGPARFECCQSQKMSVHVVQTMRMCKGFQLKTPNSSTMETPAAAWPPRRLCYRPAVFVCYLSPIALSFSQGKIRRAFKNVTMLFYFIYFLNCLTLKFRNVKLSDSGVCL